MPELPEVTTVVRALNRAVRGKTIRRVTTDSPKLVRPQTVRAFTDAVRGKTFLKFSRRAKYILAELGGGKPVTGRRRPVTRIVLWHLGMTGHPLFRDPRREALDPRRAVPFRDPMNRHVRLTFHFTDGTRLDYADVRKFGKLNVLAPEAVETHPVIRALGPDALVLARDPLALRARLRRRSTILKAALLDQTVLGGVGNIYADEALWMARRHPRARTRKLTAAQAAELARALRAVLTAGIRAHGTSVDDFRRLDGTKGAYGSHRKAYQRSGLPCPRCGTTLRRLVVGGRGTTVCPRCQRR